MGTPGWGSGWDSATVARHTVTTNMRVALVSDWQDRGHDDQFPTAQRATRRFTLGAPRGFQVSPDGARVLFLRSRSGTDPVTCLWSLDVGGGHRAPGRRPARPWTCRARRTCPPEERARRERAREQAGGVVAYATDAADLTLAAFALSGRLFLIELARGRRGALGRRRRAGLRPASRPDRRARGLRRRAAPCACIELATGDDHRAGRARGRARHLRPRRVRRRRGDGPHARLLVGARRRRGARRARRRRPGAAAGTSPTPPTPTAHRPTSPTRPPAPRTRGWRCSCSTSTAPGATSRWDPGFPSTSPTSPGTADGAPARRAAPRPAARDAAARRPRHRACTEVVPRTRRRRGSTSSPACPRPPLGRRPGLDAPTTADTRRLVVDDEP